MTVCPVRKDTGRGGGSTCQGWEVKGALPIWGTVYSLFKMMLRGRMWGAPGSWAGLRQAAGCTGEWGWARLAGLGSSCSGAPWSCPGGSQLGWRAAERSAPRSELRRRQEPLRGSEDPGGGERVGRKVPEGKRRMVM